MRIDQRLCSRYQGLTPPAIDRLTLAEIAVMLEDLPESGPIPPSNQPNMGPVQMQAVSAVARGDVLLVAKRDRLGRDSLEVGLIERDLKKHGARVVSAAGEGTENDSPEAELMRGMIDRFAQYERSIGRDRTKRALAAKRARNERAGQIPFGFMLAADRHHLEPAPVEQRLCARIRELAASRKTLQQIADAVTAEGFTTRRGTPFRFQYVARALRRAS